jgi:thiol-disulfide isomerase/thioredoxin
VENNLYRDTAYISSYNFTPECKYPWYVLKTILHGGKQEGVEVIDVHNGNLTFQVIPTRGMSIQSVAMPSSGVTIGNIRLGWNSPVKGLVNPAFVNLMERNGLGWLDGFTEWMVRGGLEYFGGPGTDEFIDNTGNKSKMELTLHGKIGNTPASLVEVVIDRTPPFRITIRGRVDEAYLHGPKLQIMTEISTIPGASTFQISDTITNNSSLEQEFGILYHCNYSTPLMEKDAKFVSPAKQVTGINEHAAEDVSTYDVYRAPTVGFAEQVYCLTLWADSNNRTKVMLQNAAADKGVSMAFSINELPYFTLWENPVAIEDGYVTGLEPGTGFPRNRSIERKFGRVPKLAPHASRSFNIDFAILDTKEQVKAAADEIAKIKAGRETKIDRTPLPTEPETSSEKPAITIAELRKTQPGQTWEPSFTEWFGKPAPDFTITDITGKTQKVSGYKGRNLIVNFWATWCPPCRKEIPDLIELRKTTRENELAILGISTEKGQTDLVKKFASGEKMNYTVLIADPAELAPPYSKIEAIPTSFFIDPSGNIKFATIGTLNLKDINRILQAK